MIPPDIVYYVSMVTSNIIIEEYSIPHPLALVDPCCSEQCIFNILYDFYNLKESDIHGSLTSSTYIYNLACLSICLCAINVKTAETIVPKLFGPHMTPGKDMDDQIFKNLIFENFENPQHFFSKIRKIFVCFWFAMHATIEIKKGREAPSDF